MLIDYLCKRCNDNYYLEHGTCGENCTHPDPINGCPESCELCLEQVHFPPHYCNGRLEYNCKNILNYYVCKYSHKYASEIEYALHYTSIIETCEKIKVISLGCGASPDLMAIESYCLRNGINKKIKYIGVDLNESWRGIHNDIIDYFEDEDAKIKYVYEDVVDVFEDHHLKNRNILIMQYLLSYFYNNGDINEVTAFYSRIINNIVKKMERHAIIIINDVNSNRRGRDYFMMFSNMLYEEGIEHTYTKKFFDNYRLNEFQHYGQSYPSNDILFDIPPYLENYNPWEYCTSAQLIIELE